MKHGMISLNENLITTLYMVTSEWQGLELVCQQCFSHLVD